MAFYVENLLRCFAFPAPSLGGTTRLAGGVCDPVEAVFSGERLGRDPLAEVPTSVVEFYCDPSALGVTLPALLLMPETLRALAPRVELEEGLEPLRALWEVSAELEESERFALLDRLRDLLAQAEPAARQRAWQTLEQIDGAAGPSEWELRAWLWLLRHDLAHQTIRLPRTRYHRVAPLFGSAIELLSIAASTEPGGGLAVYRLQRAWSHLTLPAADPLPIELLHWSDLEKAVGQFSRASAEIRTRMLQATLAAATVDQRLTAPGAALLRMLRLRWGFPPHAYLPGTFADVA